LMYGDHICCMRTTGGGRPETDGERGLDPRSKPAEPRAFFRTEPVDLGECFFPNLDNTWEVLAEAEGELYK